jgi:hypothetical protein
VVFEEHLSAEHYKLTHTDKRPVSVEAPQLTVYSYERPLYGSRPDSATLTGVSTAGAAVVPAAAAASGDFEQKQTSGTVLAGASAAGAVVFSASTSATPSAAAAGSTTQPLAAVSTDAQPEETRVSESLASDKSKRISGKRLKNFLLGSRSKSNSTVTTAVAAGQSSSIDTADHGHSADAHVVEHKSAEPPGEHSPHHTQHRPTPLVIPLLPQSLSGSTSRPASTTHQGHPSGGIADLSYDSDSVQTKSTAPSVAPATARSGATTPASAAAAPESGLGMGHNLGLSVNFPAPHRNSISSVDSELSGGGSHTGTVNTGTAHTPSATTTTDKAKKAKTPISALKGMFKPRPATPSNGNQAGIAEVPTPVSVPGAVPAATSQTAAQTALNAEETPVASSAHLEPSRPPSNRHSLRAFFTRENSNASHASVGSSVPVSASQALSASVEAPESRSAPVVVNTQPSTPVAVVKRKKSFDSVVSWSTTGSIAPATVPATAPPAAPQSTTTPSPASASAAATAAVTPAPATQPATTALPTPALPATATLTAANTGTVPTTTAAPTAAPAGPVVTPRPVVKKIKKSMKPASVAGEYISEAAMLLPLQAAGNSWVH